jgi:hypothetical protein
MAFVTTLGHPFSDRLGGPSSDIAGTPTGHGSADTVTLCLTLGPESGYSIRQV